MTPIDAALLPVFMRVLRRYGRVTFVLADDLGPHCGFVNLDDGTIVLDRRSHDGEMAATIGHELFHLDDPDCPEDLVEQLAAAAMVSLPDVLGGVLVDDLGSVASDCGVDVALVRARLRSITLDRGEGIGGVG